MNVQSKLVVTAAEFTRQFGQLRHGPVDVPVFITHHGRETHVLLGAAYYHALRHGGGSIRAQRDLLEDVAEFAKLLPQGMLLLDSTGGILAANSAAGAMLCQSSDLLCGRPFAVALPDVAVSPIGGCIRCAIDSGETQRADLPSPTRPGRWLQVDCHPSARHTVVLLHDITEDVVHHRLADRDRAAAHALRLHAMTGEIVLSMRGQIETIDGAVAGWLGLSAERLVGVALADLVPINGRALIREQIDGVLRGNGPASFACALLSNSGTAVRIDLTLVELRGVYGSEGALALLTRG